MNKYLWFALVIGLVLGIGGWLIFMPNSATAPSTATSTASAASSTLVDLGNGYRVALPAGASIEALPVGTPAPAHPSLTRPITFSSGVSAADQASLTAQEQSTLAQLKTAPMRVDLWLQLGNERKLAGDYQGAIDAWTYVAKAGPTTINYVAYGNLADLYTNWNKDFAKAAANLKAAIAIKPDNIDFYRHYAELYLNYGYDKVGAQAIVAQGLKANPGNKDLLTLQAQLNAK